MLFGRGVPRAYSGDLRIRVIGAVEGGLSARGAARGWGWVNRRRPPGLVGGGGRGVRRPKSQKGRSRSPLAAHALWLLALIEEEADLDLPSEKWTRGYAASTSACCGVM
jgi:hypothetical protein